MNITFLYDTDTYEIATVIASETTSSDEIESIVKSIKAAKPCEWDWEDIFSALPDDCGVYYRTIGNTVSI